MLKQARVISLFAVLGLLITSCATYDLDESESNTLSGSLSKMIKKKDRGRQVTADESDKAPIYVDYSKSNPILLHDDEYKSDKPYSEEDPFEEQVRFSEYEKMKKKQQAKRSMEEDHTFSKAKDDDTPVSIW